MKRKREGNSFEHPSKKCKHDDDNEIEYIVNIQLQDCKSSKMYTNAKMFPIPFSNLEGLTHCVLVDRDCYYRLRIDQRYKSTRIPVAEEDANVWVEIFIDGKELPPENDNISHYLPVEGMTINEFCKIDGEKEVTSRLMFKEPTKTSSRNRRKKKKRKMAIVEDEVKNLGKFELRFSRTKKTDLKKVAAEKIEDECSEVLKYKILEEDDTVTKIPSTNVTEEITKERGVFTSFVPDKIRKKTDVLIEEEEEIDYEIETHTMEAKPFLTYRIQVCNHLNLIHASHKYGFDISEIENGVVEEIVKDESNESSLVDLTKSQEDLLPSDTKFGDNFGRVKYYFECWNVEKVRSFIDNIKGLEAAQGEVGKRFEKHGITGDMLKDYDDHEKLKAIGIKIFGYRKKIIRSIHYLKK